MQSNIDNSCKVRTGLSENTAYDSAGQVPIGVFFTVVDIGTSDSSSFIFFNQPRSLVSFLFTVYRLCGVHHCSFSHMNEFWDYYCKYVYNLYKGAHKIKKST